MPGTTQKAANGVGVSPGEYRLVSWELDLTGRRLLDEICQISSYTPGHEFAQYVMPYRKPNPAAQHRHNIKIVSTGRYRVMKNNATGKVLKTKSEISALTDFLAWLETVRAKDGVILLSYESRTVIPHILLESLKKYNLMESFCAIVKGFVNGYDIAEEKCSKVANNNSLHSLSRLLLGKNETISTSVDRARLALEVVIHLCTPEKESVIEQGSGDTVHEKEPEDAHIGDGDKKIVSAEVTAAVCELAHTVDAEESELTELKALLVRQSTFRPIFGPMVQKNRRERQRASVQRQLIAEAGLDYGILETAFKENGKDGIAKLMTEKLTSTNSSVAEELLKLLVDHFDPPKEEVKVEQNGKEEVKQDAKKSPERNDQVAETIVQNGKEETKQAAKTAADKTATDSGADSPEVNTSNISYQSAISTPPGVEAPAIIASSPEH